MTAPHIRDLDLPDWHEVPAGAIIPAGTRYLCICPGGGRFVEITLSDYHAGDRDPDRDGYRYFTAYPIPDPREGEIDAEAARLFEIVYVGSTWKFTAQSVREGFLRLAAEFLDMQKEN